MRRTVQAVCFLLFLILFFYVCWPYGSPGYAETMRAKEIIDAETFLALDPLVSICAAIAARAWVWSLAWAGAILVVCLVIPRGFCGYVCPLGTLIDLFDWALGRRIPRSHIRRNGWWRHLRYYVLLATLVAAAMGGMLAGFVAPMAVLTRAMQFLFAPLQHGLLQAWYLVPPMNAGHYVSIVLFLGLLALSLLGRRFWCRCVCPSGAVFSIANAGRVMERKLDATCTGCGKCAEACPFDAIRSDFTTRTADCTFCRTCAGVCPVNAIRFAPRWRRTSVMPSDAALGVEVPLSRRGFVAGALGGAAGAFGVGQLSAAAFEPPVRPPGSVPEREFLRMCVRCGLCFKACPNDVLQPMAFEQGLDSLWTPQVVASWSGCEPTCNNCGQVCLTGAIRALPLQEKRSARMGLAVVDQRTCLPYAGREACRMCVDECNAAGYNAIELIRVHVEIDADGQPVEGSGYAAPVVLADRCVGCGLCQTRCHGINVAEKRLLLRTAICVVAGPGNEDRLMSGSYIALREAERRAKLEEQQKGGGSYLPEFLK